MQQLADISPRLKRPDGLGVGGCPAVVTRQPGDRHACDRPGAVTRRRPRSGWFRHPTAGWSVPRRSGLFSRTICAGKAARVVAARSGCWGRASRRLLVAAVCSRPGWRPPRARFRRPRGSGAERPGRWGRRGGAGLILPVVLLALGQGGQLVSVGAWIGGFVGGVVVVDEFSFGSGGSHLELVVGRGALGVLATGTRASWGRSCPMSTTSVPGPGQELPG